MNYRILTPAMRQKFGPKACMVYWRYIRHPDDATFVGIAQVSGELDLPGITVTPIEDSSDITVELSNTLLEDFAEQANLLRFEISGDI